MRGTAFGRVGAVVGLPLAPVGSLEVLKLERGSVVRGGWVCSLEATGDTGALFTSFVSDFLLLVVTRTIKIMMATAKYPSPTYISVLDTDD